MDYILPVKRLVVSENTGKWCQLPYPNHPKGCPKYGKDKWCPPQAPMVYDYFDMSKPLYFVHSEFDFKKHCQKMKREHPDWTDRQCKCVLYWQNTSRKQMRVRVKLAAWKLGTTLKVECPEAMGVNVYATARISGLKLDKIRDLTICRHVTLLGCGRINNHGSYGK